MKIVINGKMVYKYGKKVDKLKKNIKLWQNSPHPKRYAKLVKKQYRELFLRT